MPAYSLITDGKRLDGSAMPRLVREFQDAVIGKSIIRAGYLDMDGQAWPILLLMDPKTRQQSHILIQCDDEGNGPGVPVTNTDCMLCQTALKNT